MFKSAACRLDLPFYSILIHIIFLYGVFVNTNLSCYNLNFYIISAYLNKSNFFCRRCVIALRQERLNEKGQILDILINGIQICPIGKVCVGLNLDGCNLCKYSSHITISDMLLPNECTLLDLIFSTFICHLHTK